MAEPDDDKQRGIVGAAARLLVRMTPSSLLPSSRSILRELLGPDAPERSDNLVRDPFQPPNRHGLVRHLASRHTLESPAGDGGVGPDEVERLLGERMEAVGMQLENLRPDRMAQVLFLLADEYASAYLDDTAGMARFYLFAAIASMEGLEGEDAIDRDEFRACLAEFFADHHASHRERFSLLTAAMGRIDRNGDDADDLTHALAYVTEGFLLRATLDPELVGDRDRAVSLFRRALASITMAFTTTEADDRDVDAYLVDGLALHDEDAPA